MKKYDFSQYDLSSDELSALIDKTIIGTNAERNRKILKRRLIDGIKYEALAEEKGIELSAVQIKRIVYKESSKLFKVIHYFPQENSETHSLNEEEWAIIL